MHYRITTVGPINREHLTDVLLTYMNYPSYLSPNHNKPATANGPVWPASPLLGKAGKAGGLASTRRKSVGQTRPASPWLGKMGALGEPVRPAFKPTTPPEWIGRPSLREITQGREAGTPMMSQTGNPVRVAPGIELQLLGNLGRTYHDSFFWEAEGRTHLLEVTHRGAYYEWQTLPAGWDNPHLAQAPAADLGTFKPGREQILSVASLTTAQKVGEAMYRSLKYVGEEVKPILLDIISPETIGYAIKIEMAYTVSLFFGVGEVLTAVLVVAGVYFVGQQVKDIVESLVGFVRKATTAQSEGDLEEAARLFAHAMTLGVDVVVSLLRRKARPAGEGNTVLRAKASGGRGEKSPKSMTSSSVSPTPQASPPASANIGNGAKSPGNSTNDITKKGKSKNKLEPDPKATGDHSTFERDKDGNIYKYETYERTSTGHNDPKIRFDGGKPDGSPGSPHRDKSGNQIPTPHVQGKSIPNGVRPPASDEVPNNKRFPKKTE